MKKQGKVLTMRITEKEEKIVDELKKNYSVNISQFIRNKLTELHKSLNKNMGDELWQLKK